jgi:hypothetical protein
MKKKSNYHEFIVTLDYFAILSDGIFIAFALFFLTLQHYLNHALNILTNLRYD